MSGWRFSEMLVSALAVTLQMGCSDARPASPPGAVRCIPGVCGELDAPCVRGQCDEATGACRQEEAPDGTVCDDGDACTSDDACAAGLCAGAPKSCASAACTRAMCDPGSGACVEQDLCALLDGPCVVGVCRAGGCATEPRADGTPCDDGSVCTRGDACEAGVCVGPPVECDDGIYCNGAEVCRSEVGCVQEPRSCDDAVECTLDVCSVAQDECEHTPSHAACDGEQWCDPFAGCVEPLSCGLDVHCSGSDASVCNGLERCESGRCVPGTPLECDDAFACTLDQCSDVQGGCVHTPIHSECDDGLYCSGVEQCSPESSGSDARGCAAGAPVVCADDACHAGSRCDEAQGACVSTLLQPDADGDGYVDRICGDDCNDGDASIHPGAVETCDATYRDEDCDGTVDEGIAYESLQTTLLWRPALDNITPSLGLAAGEDQFAVVGLDAAHQYAFQKFSADGEPMLAAPLTVSNSDESNWKEYVSLVHQRETAYDFVFGYADETYNVNSSWLYRRTLDASGPHVGPAEGPFYGPMSDPTAIRVGPWVSAAFWSDGPLKFMAIGDDGAVAANLVVHTGSTRLAPAMAWSGEEVLVVFEDASQKVKGRRIGLVEGEWSTIGSVALLAAGVRPAVAWNGSDWVVAYVRNGPVYSVAARRFTTDLQPIGEEVTLHAAPPSPEPRVRIAAGTHGSVGVLWDTQQAPYLAFRRFDRTLQPLGPRVDVPGLTHAPLPLAIAHGNGRFAVGWRTSVKASVTYPTPAANAEPGDWLSVIGCR